MKTLLLFASVCLSGTIYSQTINYLAGNPVWQEYYSERTQQGCMMNSSYNYHLGEEKVISGKTYRALNSSGKREYYGLGPQGGCSVSSEYFQQLEGYIRQEGQSIYFTSGGSDEQLLYDFDIEAGERLPLSYINSDDNVIVQSIDTILVGTEQRRRFNLKTDGNTRSGYILEGIGNEQGFLRHISQPFEGTYNFVCFRTDNGTFPEGGNCNFTLSLDELQPMPLLQVYPNPATDKVTIDLQIASAVENVVVTDVTGRCIKPGYKCRDNTLTLDISGLDAGMHFIRVMYSDGREKQARPLFVLPD